MRRLISKMVLVGLDGAYSPTGQLAARQAPHAQPLTWFLAASPTNRSPVGGANPT